MRKPCSKFWLSLVSICWQLTTDVIYLSNLLLLQNRSTAAAAPVVQHTCHLVRRRVRGVAKDQYWALIDRQFIKDCRQLVKKRRRQCLTAGSVDAKYDEVTACR